VYYWQARHPDWEPNDGWDEVVTSYALDDGERLIVIDPLAAPPELELLAGKREIAIVLTCPWHVRDTVNLADRLDAAVYVPPADEGETDPVAGTVYDFRRARVIADTELDTGYAELTRDADGLARVRISDPVTGHTVTLWQDAAFPYLMLFTGDSDPEPSRRRRGLGVEPMSCAPNALQSGEGLLVLEPGARFRGCWGITPGA
jgi:hypothetical protein